MSDEAFCSAVFILPLLPSSGSGPEVTVGLRALWNPAVILFLQALWIIMFVQTGRSQVTGSALSFLVHQDRI